MSQQCSKLCSLIIGETFGMPVQSVVDILLQRGPSPLRHVLTSMAKSMPIEAIHGALKTLIQHFVVNFHVNPTTGETIYSVNHGMTIELMRYPRYYAHAEQMVGPVGREVLEEIVQSGLVSISKLIYICGSRVLKSNPDVTESVLFEQLNLFQTTVLRLAAKKYIVIIPPPSSNDENNEADPGAQKDSHKLPAVDLKVLLGKLLKTNETKLENLPDANILWGIYIQQFHAELRNSMVYQALERKFKSMIDPRVIQVVIEVGLERHQWEDEGAPVSMHEIKDRIEKMSGGLATSKYISEHLEIVEDDPMRVLTRLSNQLGGHFAFNMKTAVSELLWNTVDKIITEKHGFHALRIFRLVKDSGFVEQDTINEIGMVPGKDAKHLTYKLVDDHFINIKEVKKTYTTNAPPGKTCTVFYVDSSQIVRSLQEYCYKAAYSLKLKSKIEQAKIKRLSVKEERITRILVNMTNKNCAEDQLNEIRELLTPPERGLLLRYQFSSGKLLSGTIQVDETLFVTELYLKYHGKYIPKKK